jgi:outer membrane protein OmpA-like peptidoglycan-associated protein
MKGIFFVLLLSMSMLCFGQKPSIIGFSANVVDFSTSVPRSSKLDPGFSVMYWKGITQKLDFSLRYNGLFSDYTKKENNSSGYINEFEGSLHIRPINDDHILSPFLSAGIGVGNYSGGWATYAPLGGGLQINMMGEGYIFLQANYRATLKSSLLDNNMFYSLGFTQTISAPRVKKPEALPPPPVVEVKDRDKDGVADSLDACPDLAGPAQLNGCPDADGDGIPDKDDKCPGVAGTAKYQGCPIPDTDGDGINDEADKCPDVAGVAKYQGCPIPDRDSDGVNDEEDKCPDLAGDRANNGCPVVKEEVKKRAEYAASHIYFATASHVLLKKSNKGLDDVVQLMMADRGLRLSVNGYTDNTGKPEKNQLLSEERAGAVRKYLLSKGIAADRIIATGFGQADPVADNKTAAGRARNRRVEMKLGY